MNPRANNVPLLPRPEAAFNLVEVALAMAIVAFALTAIFGVLPAGVTVMRDNRAETIINYDARYWMEAIRSGQMPLSYNLDGSVKEWQAVSHSAFTNHVHWVRVERPSGTNTFLYTKQPDWPELVLGRLSFPYSITDVVPVENGVKIFAKVRSLTGRMGDTNAPSTFYYLMETSVMPMTTNLYHLRLTFRWNLRTGIAGDLLADDIANLQVDASGNLVNVRRDPTNNTLYANHEGDPRIPARVAGTGFKTFTTLVSGALFGGYRNTDPARKVGEDWVRQKPVGAIDQTDRLYYFRPTMFEPF